MTGKPAQSRRATASWGPPCRGLALPALKDAHRVGPGAGAAGTERRTCVLRADEGHLVGVGLQADEAALPVHRLVRVRVEGVEPAREGQVSAGPRGPTQNPCEGRCGLSATTCVGGGRVRTWAPAGSTLPGRRLSPLCCFCASRALPADAPHRRQCQLPGAEAPRPWRALCGAPVLPPHPPSWGCTRGQQQGHGSLRTCLWTAKSQCRGEHCPRALPRCSEPVTAAAGSVPTTDEPLTGVCWWLQLTSGLGKTSAAVHWWTAKQFRGDCLNNKVTASGRDPCSHSPVPAGPAGVLGHLDPERDTSDHTRSSASSQTHVVCSVSCSFQCQSPHSLLGWSPPF